MKNLKLLKGIVNIEFLLSIITLMLNLVGKVDYTMLNFLKTLGVLHVAIVATMIVLIIICLIIMVIFNYK